MNRLEVWKHLKFGSSGNFYGSHAQKKESNQKFHFGPNLKENSYRISNKEKHRIRDIFYGEKSTESYTRQLAKELTGKMT